MAGLTQNKKVSFHCVHWVELIKVVLQSCCEFISTWLKRLEYIRTQLNIWKSKKQNLENVNLCQPQDLKHLHPLTYPLTTNQNELQAPSMISMLNKFFYRVKRWQKSLKETTKQLLLMLTFYQAIVMESKNETNIHFKSQFRAWKSSNLINEKAFVDYYMKLHQGILMNAVVWFVSIHTEQKANLNYMRIWIQIIIIVL